MTAPNRTTNPTTSRKRDYHLSVRSELRDVPDLQKLAKALVLEALAKQERTAALNAPTLQHQVHRALAEPHPISDSLLGETTQIEPDDLVFLSGRGAWDLPGEASVSSDVVDGLTAEIEASSDARS